MDLESLASDEEKKLRGIGSTNYVNLHVTKPNIYKQVLETTVFRSKHPIRRELFVLNANKYYVRMYFVMCMQLLILCNAHLDAIHSSVLAGISVHALSVQFLKGGVGLGLSQRVQLGHLVGA